MDTLGASDGKGVGGGGGGGRNPAAPATLPPPLPPQLFTTAASLLELTDKKLLITLRDGRKLTGVLRSWDQYGNLVLQSTVERRQLPLEKSVVLGSNGDDHTMATTTRTTHIYSDEDKGLYLVRGENIVLMGEIDLDRDDAPPPASHAAVSAREMHAAERAALPARRRRDAARARALLRLGSEEEHRGDALV